MQGRIIKQISNLYTVHTDNGDIECGARGKLRNLSLTPVVGDICTIDDNNLITNISPRKNELERPVIANVDAALIITSVKKPDLSLNLLDKLISLITINKIKPIIVLTKLDLLDNKKEIKKIVNYYRSIGIPVVTNNNLFKLKRLIKHKYVVLCGQTGAGKSSLLNKLDKKLDLKTSPISDALGRGVHTTRHVEFFKVGSSFIADTPGFSALDLSKYTKEQIRDSFNEFKGVSCQFKDCMHLKEKGCLINNNKNILDSRYENYLSFLKEVK